MWWVSTTLVWSGAIVSYIEVFRRESIADYRLKTPQIVRLLFWPIQLVALTGYLLWQADILNEPMNTGILVPQPTAYVIAATLPHTVWPFVARERMHSRVHALSSVCLLWCSALVTIPLLVGTFQDRLGVAAIGISLVCVVSFWNAIHWTLVVRGM